MAHIRTINKEEYAAKALELFNNNREDYVTFACDCLKDGDTPEHARERLVRRVESQMERALFNYLKRTGKIEGDIRYDYTLGYYRRKRVEPRLSDVPSGLLNISEVLMISETVSRFTDLIDSVLLDARKLLLVARIETTVTQAEKDSKSTK